VSIDVTGHAIGPGRTVIEASAGTGKTHTIAALVAHLVAVEGVAIERILVITFTRAATAELAGRIRSRLVEALTVVRDGVESSDEHMAELVASLPAELIESRVAAALSSFDQAQIFTIHGFAQRLLGVLGFGSRLPTELEPVALDSRTMAVAAADLVVGRWAGVEDGRDRISPADLARIGMEVVSKPDARIVPSPEHTAGRARARVEMAHAIRAEMARRMRHAGQVSFDDGLAELVDVLADPEVGEQARRLLAARYEIGLVDEAQDTDPMQWKVIRAIFEQGRLVVIGDPKQSIYRFRGADIDAYLDAARGAERRQLDTNWRSDGPLLEALDLLFDGATFGDEDIAYVPVRPADGRSGSRIAGVPAALSLRWLSSDIGVEKRSDRPQFFSLFPTRRAVAADVAAQVVDMLESGIRLEDRDLQPSDVAVLCRTSRQVDMVRAELDKRRVPSVSGRSGAVFVSRAAEEWRRFLMAVEHPERMDLVRLGATSLLMGMELADVAALDDMAEVTLQLEMRSLQRILHDVGVPRLISEVDRTRHLTERVLLRPDGERVMTDLTHIAEELHAAWRPGRMGSLVAWLEDAIRESNQREKDFAEEPEARQRRLETDAEAVQVLTVHASKGLEWPVVLVPYGWDVWDRTPDIPVRHDRAGGGRVVDVAGKEGWAGFDDNAAAARREERAEESRLLYVALTRARHHLVVWWVKHIEDAPTSTLGKLLARQSWKEAARTARPGLVAAPAVTALPEVRRYGGGSRTEATLAAAIFDRPLDHTWRRVSFSSLSPDHVVTDEVAELKADDELGDDTEAVAPADLPMADLPKGARFGTLVHEIFESVSFDDPDLEESLRAVLAPAMHRSGWEFDPEAFVAGMVGAITTPLGPSPADPSLSGVGRVLKELVFELPVPATVSLTDVGAVMRAHLSGEDPFRAYADRLLEGDVQSFRGFLTGAIDLTLALGDGRWVVMDYKSNALPDYGAAAVSHAMIEGNYVLQATLYQVALHRYLSWRLPGYDPDVNLGGSIYLFLRGAIGPDTPVVDGVRQGVNVWTPPPAMVVALSELFRGRGA
jgi:exodeoxyribonuclease V beta subunit